MRKVFGILFCFVFCFFFFNIYEVFAATSCPVGEKYGTLYTCKATVPTGNCYAGNDSGTGQLEHSYKVNDPVTKPGSVNKINPGSVPYSYKYKILILFDDSNSMVKRDRTKRTVRKNGRNVTQYKCDNDSWKTSCGSSDGGYKYTYSDAYGRVATLNNAIKKIVQQIRQKLNDAGRAAGKGENFSQNSLLTVKRFSTGDSSFVVHDQPLSDNFYETHNVATLDMFGADTMYENALEYAKDYFVTDSRYKYIVVFVTDGYPTSMNDQSLGYLSSARYFYNATKGFYRLRKKLDLYDSEVNKLVTVGIDLSNTDKMANYLLNPTSDHYTALGSGNDSEAKRYKNMVSGATSNEEEFLLGVGGYPDWGLVGHNDSVSPTKICFNKPNSILPDSKLGNVTSRTAEHNVYLLVGPFANGSSLNYNDVKMCNSSEGNCKNANFILNDKWAAFESGRVSWMKGLFNNQVCVYAENRKSFSYKKYKNDAFIDNGKDLRTLIEGNLVDKYYAGNSVNSADWLHVLFPDVASDTCGTDSYDYNVKEIEGNCSPNGSEINVEIKNVTSKNLYYKLVYLNGNTKVEETKQITRISVPVIFFENFKFFAGTLRNYNSDGNKILAGQGFDFNNIRWTDEVNWTYAMWDPDNNPMVKATVSGVEYTISLKNILDSSNIRAYTNVELQNLIMNDTHSNMKNNYIQNNISWSANNFETIDSNNVNGTSNVKVLATLSGDTGFESKKRILSGNISGYRAAKVDDDGFHHAESKLDYYNYPTVSNPSGAVWLDNTEVGWENRVHYYYSPVDFKGSSFDVNITVPTSAMSNSTGNLKCIVRVGPNGDDRVKFRAVRILDGYDPFPKALSSVSKMPYNWGKWYCQNYMIDTGKCDEYSEKKARMMNTYSKLDYKIDLSKSDFNKYNSSGSNYIDTSGMNRSTGKSNYLVDKVSTYSSTGVKYCPIGENKYTSGVSCVDD